MRSSSTTPLLSKVYAQLRGISPVAWQHVNLFGSFQFSDAASKVDIDALAARYADDRLLDSGAHTHSRKKQPKFV